MDLLPLNQRIAIQLQRADARFPKQIREPIPVPPKPIIPQKYLVALKKTTEATPKQEVNLANQPKTAKRKRGRRGGAKRKLLKQAAGYSTFKEAFLDTALGEQQSNEKLIAHQKLDEMRVITREQRNRRMKKSKKQQLKFLERMGVSTKNSINDTEACEENK